MTATKKTTVKSTIVARETLSFRAGWKALHARIEELKATGKYTDVKSRRVNYGDFTILCYAPADVETQTRGTCQLCGGAFSVESGVLSLHGYKRPRWGYLVGRCAGHNHLPAEQSVSLTTAALVSLDAQIPAAVARAEQAKLDAEAVFAQHPYGDLHRDAYADYRDARIHADNLVGYAQHLRENVLPRHGKPLYEVAR